MKFYWQNQHSKFSGADELALGSSDWSIGRKKKRLGLAPNSAAARWQFALILTLFLCAHLVALLPTPLAATSASGGFLNFDAVLHDARQARQRFDYAEALRLLDNLAPTHKASAALLNEYGMIYLDAEEVQKAQEYFDKALKIKPPSEGAIAGRAAVDVMNRDYQVAETRLRDYLVQNPQSGRAHALLALVCFENNRAEEAEVEAQRALAIAPDDLDALHVLVLVKVIDKAPNEARRLAERALEIDPFDPDMRRVLAQFVDGRAGFLQKVAEAARQHYEQGRALKQAGKFAAAVAELEKALSIEPRYYRALIALGDIWLRQEDFERAATAARLAIAIDANGAGGQLELSYANAGMQERGRIEIGAPDFATEYFKKPRAQACALTAEIFPNYQALTKRQQMVIDRAVEPLAFFLPELARKGAKHYLIAFDERTTDIKGISTIENERTVDGRYYASIRGVGGRITVSGLEYIGLAAHAGFNTIAHEFAHQVHMTAMDKGYVKTIRRLYETACREHRVLDYYAATDEYEYFAQGYEAYIAEVKRPATGATSRHTRRDLLLRDPDLYRFIEGLAKKSR
ncbi:MAG: tetratricopeptide repeat protein [Acidobacteria bacterium]|nr:tetratricopeptide repeat protein [Acidobacteriota bacterium]